MRAGKLDGRLAYVLGREVITPGGNWSSYPPHKHDRDALPEESYLEETYDHRLSPPPTTARSTRR